MRKLVDVGKEADYNNMKFAVSNQGMIVSTQIQLDKDIVGDKIHAKKLYHESQNWSQIFLHINSKTYFEQMKMENKEKMDETLHKAPDSHLRRV